MSVMSRNRDEGIKGTREQGYEGRRGKEAMRTPPPEERGGVPATSVISDQRRPEIETADAGEGVGASALSRESGVVAAKRKRRCPPPPEWIVCLARKVWSKEGLACAMAAATGWANIGCMIRYSGTSTKGLLNSKVYSHHSLRP